MLFMVIERFENGDMAPVYRRLAERGRQLPAGLDYVASWVAADYSRCYQVMACEDRSLIDLWTEQWRGTGVLFEEVVPVVTSAEAQAAWAAKRG
ncbi:MAG TPA: DUF3303 family protein [Allosphingosinicella sp.]|nr:DUF3303 family protein [Allosphingosinicella sp.]